MVYVCMAVWFVCVWMYAPPCGVCLVCQEAQACRRQWCRVLVKNEKHGKWKGPLEEMFDFFTVYPGLQMFVGGLLLRFYNPVTADCFGKRKRCSIS